MIFREVFYLFKKWAVGIDKRVTGLIIDGDSRSQLLELANHSLPNASTLRINRKGFPEVIYYAIEDIEEGNPIYWDYGRMYFSNGYQFEELCPDRVIDFIKNLEGKYIICGHNKEKNQYFDYRLKFVNDRPEWEKVPVASPKINAMEREHASSGLSYIFEFPEAILGNEQAKKVFLKFLLLLKHNNQLTRFGLNDEKFGVLAKKLLGK